MAAEDESKLAEVAEEDKENKKVPANVPSPAKESDRKVESVQQPVSSGGSPQETTEQLTASQEKAASPKPSPTKEVSKA